MFPDFYSISEENFKKSVKYFNITNNKIKYSHQSLAQFKQYTVEYCSKLEQLIKDGNNLMEEYIIIDSDYMINYTDESDNSKKKDDFEKNFINPIEKSTDRIQNFFGSLVKYLTDFIKNLEIQTNGIEQYITITKNEVETIKKDYEKQQDIFKLKFEEYKDINSKLKSNYYEGEKKLIQFCYDRRLDGVAYDNNLKVSFDNLVDEQNNLIEIYNSLGNYEKIFLDCTKEKLGLIQDYSSSIFLKYDNLSKIIHNMFNTSLLCPMNKLREEILKSIEEAGLDNKFKNNISSILANQINNIGEKNVKLELDKYNITILLNRNVKIERNLEENGTNSTKPKKEKTTNDNKNINNNPNIVNILLTDKEIFFIVKNMYSEYKYINQSKYELKLEEKKLELRDIFEKIINCPSTKEKEKEKDEKKEEKKEEINNIEENKQITKEAFDELCAKMSDDLYRKGLLIIINNYRAKGKLELSDNAFNYVIQIFSEACKNIVSSEEKIKENGKFVKDYVCSRLIIILSQTFYTMKNDEKFYICDELKKEKIFHTPEFWQELISNMISDESKMVLENQKKLYPNVNDKKIKKVKDDIYFAQTIPFVGNMKDFGLDIKEIKKIISKIIKEFNMPEETSKKIEEYIDSQFNV